MAAWLHKERCYAQRAVKSTQFESWVIREETQKSRGGKHDPVVHPMFPAIDLVNLDFHRKWFFCALKYPMDTVHPSAKLSCFRMISAETGRAEGLSCSAVRKLRINFNPLFLR